MSSVSAFTASSFVNWLLAHRILVIVSVMFAVLICAIGLIFLSFTFDNRIYFAPDNPERLALERVERDHGRYANVVLVVAPKTGTVLTSEPLNIIRDVHRRFSKIEDVTQVNSVLNLTGRGQADFAISASEEEVNETLLASLRNDLVSRGPELRAFISKDRTVAGVTALISLGDDAADRQTSAGRQFQDVRSDLSSLYPNVDFYLTGDAILDLTFVEAILRDLIYLVPLQVIATVVLLLVCLQSVGLTFSVLLVLGAATTVTMGAAGFLGLQINGATSATPVILLGLSIATCIHLIFTWQRERRNGVSANGALTTAVCLNAFPITLATATTIVSFLCMNFSDAPPFRELGNLVALGLLVTWALTFSLLPVLISFFPDAVGNRGRRMASLLEAFGRGTIACRQIIVVGAIALVCGSIWGISQLRFDDRFAHYFDKSFDFRNSTDIFEDHLSGLTVVKFSLPSNIREDIWSHDYLSAVVQFSAWLEMQEHVTQVQSLGKVVLVAARSVSGQAADVLPPDGALLEAITTSLRKKLASSATPNLLATMDQKRSLVTVTLRAASSADVRDFATRAEAWLGQHVPDHFAPATGIPVISAYMSQRNANSMVLGTFLALLIVSVMMFLILRNVRLGLASLIPNLVPMVLAFGFWGMAFGQASFAVTVVSAITFGLVVDGTIHFLSKYHYARATLGLPVADAIPHSMSTVGLALLATSLAVASGFANLAFSGFLVNHELGLLSCIVLVAALIADLIFLPALIATIDKDVPSES